MNDEILALIGAKEIELYQLQKQVYELTNALDEANKKIEELSSKEEVKIK